MNAADGVRVTRDGYDGAASAWADRAELVYGPWPMHRCHART